MLHNYSRQSQQHKPTSNMASSSSSSSSQRRINCTSKSAAASTIIILAAAAALLESIHVVGGVGIGFPQTLPDLDHPPTNTYYTTNTNTNTNTARSDNDNDNNSDNDNDNDSDSHEGTRSSEEHTDADDTDDVIDNEYNKSTNTNTSFTDILHNEDERHDLDNDNGDDGNRPLETLKKLQAMLDETDYAVQPTASSPSSNNIDTAAIIDNDTDKSPNPKSKFQSQQTKTKTMANGIQTTATTTTTTTGPSEQFWTSADRSKYRRKQKEVARTRAHSLQQQKQRANHHQQQQQQQKGMPMSMGMSSEDYDEIIVGNSSAEETDSSSTMSSSVPTYTLPNLPVYLSDNDEDEDEDETDYIDQIHPSESSKLSLDTSPSSSSTALAPPQQGQSPPYEYHTRGNTQMNNQVPRSNASAYNYPNHLYGNQYPQYPYSYHHPLHQHGDTYYHSNSQQRQQLPQQQQHHSTNIYPAPPYPSYHSMYAMRGHVHSYSTSSSTDSEQNSQHRYAPPNYIDPRYYWSQGVGAPYPYSSGIDMRAPPVADLVRKNDNENMKFDQSLSDGRFGDAGAKIQIEMNKKHLNQSSGIAMSNFDGSQVKSNIPSTEPLPYNGNGNVASLAGTLLSFDSVQKLLFVLTSAMLLSYCSVSPRTLPVVQYNAAFKRNMQLLMFVVIPPSAIFFSVLNAQQNDINALVTTFHRSFTVGFIFTFLLEMILASILRLIVFAFWEPAIFELTPTIPLPVLPWVLRSEGYRPKRITLFVADFAVSCVAAPVVEELMKLKIVEWGSNLPKNYKATKKISKKGKMKRKMEPIPFEGGQFDVTDINNYVSQLFAASLGLKLADSVRRVLMYTKQKNEHKSFYALCRGLFPIHELCGTMTALQLAKRDVLGINIPLWRMLLPSVFIHSMAIFRGMKPIYKWNSATPWTEMQLSPWSIDDDSTLMQIVNKGLAKLMWISILARVLGYCIKNYYMISRQARKQATTYAGKRAAFLSELVADEMLKKSKKEEKKKNASE